MSNLDSTELRINFIKAFGEDLTVRAERHSNESREWQRGTNHFRWVLVYCVGSGFFAKEPCWPRLRKWIKSSGGFKLYDGVMDYDALMAGTFREFLPAQRIHRKKSYA